jgi:hypothetical protein
MNNDWKVWRFLALNDVGFKIIIFKSKMVTFKDRLWVFGLQKRVRRDGYGWKSRLLENTQFFCERKA